MKKDLYKSLSKRDMGQILDLSFKSINCTSQIEFIENVKELKKLFLIDTLLYTTTKIKSLYDDKPLVEVVDISCPDGYVDFYVKNKYHKTDAAIWEFLSTLEPVNWMAIDCGFKKNYPASVSAPDFGMNDGWTHGVFNIAEMQISLFFLGSFQRCKDKRAKQILNYIVPFLCESYQRVRSVKSINDPGLTPREKEVLNWIKEGKSSWEISVILNCSKRVVDFHVTNMKRKLDVTSRPQLIANALSRGLISF